MLILVLMSMVLLLVGCNKDEPVDYVEPEPVVEEPVDIKTENLKKYFNQLVYTYELDNLAQAKEEQKQEEMEIKQKEDERTKLRDKYQRKYDNQPQMVVYDSKKDDRLDNIYDVLKYKFDESITVIESEELGNTMPEYYLYDEGTLMVTPEQSLNKIKGTTKDLEKVRFDINREDQTVTVVVRIKNKKEWPISPLESISVYYYTEELAPINKSVELVEGNQEVEYKAVYSTKRKDDYEQFRLHIKSYTQEVEKFEYNIEDIDIHTFKYGVRRAKEGKEEDAKEFENTHYNVGDTSHQEKGELDTQESEDSIISNDSGNKAELGDDKTHEE